MDCCKEKDKGPQGPSDGKLVLLGNPNVGKSVIFGVLTGRYATVSNYPGTTVEVSRGTVRIKGKDFTIIDSPGVNTLTPTSDDERVTRDILINEDVTAVLHVLDAKNIRRGLLVAIQLSELKVSSVIAVNMYDEAGEKGIRLDVEALVKETGLEIVPTIATQRWGIDKFKEAALTSRKSVLSVTYPRPIEEGVASVLKLFEGHDECTRGLALMILSGDETLDGWVNERLDGDGLLRLESIRELAQKRYSEPIGFLINKVRLAKVDAIVKRVETKEEVKQSPVLTVLGRASMHPVWGLGILAVVLFLMYEFVGVLGAGVGVDFLETHVFGEYLNPWVTRVVEWGVPFEFVRELIVGEYGLVTMALTYAVAIILPIVGFFFIFFGILEDSGYLPRLAVMVDKVFKLMGLNGKAVLPMILGLGCATMATMTARILETRKERIIVTFLLALGIPCSAQLGVILGMLGAVSFMATVIWVGTIIIVLFVVAYLSSKVVPGETSDFILEVPPLRIPQFSNIALKTLVRVQWYLKEAVPLFILGTLVLYLLDKLRLLELIERATAPVVVRLLDLPIEATSAFLIGFLRRDYGAAGLYSLQRDGMLDPVQVVVSLVTMTLFVPCIANFFMIIKERGVKTAFFMGIFIFPFALVVGGILNFILRSSGITL